MSDQYFILSIICSIYILQIFVLLLLFSIIILNFFIFFYCSSKPFVCPYLNDNNFVKFMRGTGQWVKMLLTIFTKKMNKNIYIMIMTKM